MVEIDFLKSPSQVFYFHLADICFAENSVRRNANGF